MEKTKRINCHRCQYYYVTWEPARPYGCRAMGFKSKVIPSAVVRRSTGRPCLLFKENPSAKPASKSDQKPAPKSDPKIDHKV